MIYIDNIENLTEKSPAAVAIGKFDGVHRGHRALLDKVVKAAKEYGLVSTVITFKGQPACLKRITGCPA